jgi:hypothetical protein
MKERMNWRIGKELIFPEDKWLDPVTEVRAKGKIGKWEKIAIWVNDSEECKEIIEVMERLGIAYQIIHYNYKPDPHAWDPIDRIPLPALHFTQTGEFLAGKARIKYFIYVIERVLIREISEEELKKIRKIMDEIHKEGEKEWKGPPVTRYNIG